MTLFSLVSISWCCRCSLRYLNQNYYTYYTHKWQFIEIGFYNTLKCNILYIVVIICDVKLLLINRKLYKKEQSKKTLLSITNTTTTANILNVPVYFKEATIFRYV